MYTGRSADGHRDIRRRFGSGPPEQIASKDEGFWRNRPCGRRTAEQRDDLAASHVEHRFLHRPR